jgi:phage gpG-like protein
MQPRRKEFPDFKRTAADWQRFKDNLMLYAGNTAVNFFQDSFARKGFIDKTYRPWKARKKIIKSRGSLMLVSGRLKNSIRITRLSNNYVSVGTDVPYARIHNEGGRVNKTVTITSHSRKINRSIKVSKSSLKNRRVTTRTTRIQAGTSTVREHTRKINFEMPQRQFIGESQVLLRRIEMHLFRQLDSFASSAFK